MTRGWLFLTMGIAAACPGAQTNVLFIIADDLNRHVGCFGDAVVKSPNVDTLAARGLRFERAYCQYPVCSPSRVSFLSGRRPEQTKMFGNEGDSRTPSLKDAAFMPEYFKRQGYFTARVGKVFHIGRDVPECWDVTEEGTPGNQIIYQPSEPEKLGLSGNMVDKGELDGDAGEKGTWGKLDAGDERLVDGIISRRIASLIDGAAKGEQPFFIACGFRRPHQPWIAPEEFYDRYDPSAVPLPEAAPVPLPGGKQKPAAASAESRRAAKRGYFACVSFMDRQLGRVLEAMDRNNLWGSTAVVLIGDNGYLLGSRNGYWGKGIPYEEACGVPMIVVAPGREGGRVCRRVVEYVDLYPTLVDLAGLPARKDLAGRSLRPLLDDPGAPWDHPAFSIGAREGKPAWLAVSTERYRYVEYAAASQAAELYDMRADPKEWKNLAGDPAHAEALAKLKAIASGHRQEFWE